MYKYTLLKQDGSKEELGTQKKKSLEELYETLGCQTVELIPSDYYEGHGKCRMWADEEARFNKNNVRNPHFKVLAPGFDIVGDVLKEQKS